MAKNKKDKRVAAAITHTESLTSKAPAKRAFNAAMFNRITSDWATADSINLDLQQGLRNLRGRSRDLSINNEFARRYLRLIKTNVIGSEGVQISIQAMNIDGSLDPMSDAIETHFAKWGRPENCTVTGKMDWIKAQNLVLETTARDGECLVWMRRGLQFGKYSFQLQILDADHLDENYNDTAANGNQIVQGVELNDFGRPVAYFLFRKNPADRGLQSITVNDRVRVDANDLLHIFDQERASQVRGFPWLTAAMTALHHVGKYREAELINARLASSKQVYYKQQDEVGFTGDDDAVDDEGNITFESNPGSHEILPRGWSIEKIDWSSPNQSLGEFQKTVLRGAAAGLGVSYNSLASDLESVNYSSARFGGLEDQAAFRTLQKWFINAFIKPVYEEWLQIQLLSNHWGLNIPTSKFDKFNTVRFVPRSWQSVDEYKDTNADVLQLKNSLTSWHDVISKRGKDPEEVFVQIAKDKERMTALGITPAEMLGALAAIDEEQNTETTKPNTKTNNKPN